MNNTIEQAKEILIKEYGDLLKDTDYINILNSLHISKDLQEEFKNQLNKSYLPPNATTGSVIHTVLKMVATDIPNDKVVEFTKNKMKTSFISNVVPEEKIDEAFKKIHICKDELEFKRIYLGDIDGLEGFNRNGICYLRNDCTPHSLIHEVLHTLSSEFEKDGHRTKNGLMGTINEQNGNEYNYSSEMVNEGATDYISQMISHEDSGHYRNQRYFFEKISEQLSKYFDDETALLKLYFAKDDTTFINFLNTVNKKTSAKDFYTSDIISNRERLKKYVTECEKGIEKIEKRKKFAIKHPKLSGISSKIKSMFSKNKEDVKMLPSTLTYTKENNSFVSDLKDNVNSTTNYTKTKEQNREKEKEIDENILNDLM